MNLVHVRHFEGLQDYADIWQQMRNFTDERTGDTPDEIWLLQHSPVFTLGQAGKKEHLLRPSRIPVIKSDRGGQITYHGPGQLMVYVLLDIKRRQLSVRNLVTCLENAVIALLQEFDIESYAKKSAPGVYVQKDNLEQKISAVGLRVRKGRCYHGLAFNIDMDLQPFESINPCGYAGLGVTQMANLLPKKPDWQDVENKLVQQLKNQLH
jgi:lipoyl(octanoyl) transferase